MSKLLIAIVHRDDQALVLDALAEAGLRVTQFGSQGGFLRSRNATLLMGLEDEQLPKAMAILERSCRTRTEQVPLDVLGGMDAAWLPTEVTHGGATIFVVPLDEIRRI